MTDSSLAYGITLMIFWFGVSIVGMLLVVALILKRIADALEKKK